jgi:hypothetical protein
MAVKGFFTSLQVTVTTTISYLAHTHTIPFQFMYIIVTPPVLYNYLCTQEIRNRARWVDHRSLRMWALCFVEFIHSIGSLSCFHELVLFW